MLFLTLGADMTRPSRTGGKTSEAKARNASPAKGRKTTKTRARIAAPTRAKRRPAASDPRKDLKEAREQQAATAEILKVIASSFDDVQPVFDVLVERAVQLCGACMGRVYRYDGNLIHLVGGHRLSTPGRDSAQRPFPRPASDDTIVGRVMLSRKPAILSDLNADDTVPPLSRKMIEAIGARSQVTMPMLMAGEPIGAITLSWAEPRGYNDHQIALLQTFADQAVIAIENVRLFSEVQARTRDLAESLQQQTATADVLKVISRSAFDLETVLDALLSSACRLCEADIGTIRYKEGGEFRLAATFGCPPEWIEHFQRYSTKPDRSSVFGRTIAEGHIIHIPDLLADPEYKRPEAQKLMGFKAALGVPLAREGEAFGVINLFRFNVSSFEDRQIELVQTFADQAVIAIENVRLFDEVQAKTLDLEESLQQQTAAADVLKVISSSFGDLEPVFETILEKAHRLCGVSHGSLQLYDGETFRGVAVHGLSEELAKLLRRGFIPGPNHPSQPLLKGERFSHANDLSEINDPMSRAAFNLSGIRTVLLIPLRKDGVLLGQVVAARQEVRSFSQRETALLESFAAQAVIAMENARLLNELRLRTNELSQSLDDLRAAQDRLVQTEKLASLGQLTAGIAHEIKNPLNFVNNFSALSAELTDELNDALKPVAMDGKVREEVDELTGMLKDNLEKVVQHGRRADSIVKNMLLHSRESSGQHRPADINSLLDESLNLAYHGARAEKGEFNITLQRDFDPAAGMIEIYPQEVSRVFLNLISNGFYAATRQEAMASGGFEPTLSATTKNLGNSVEIRIRDNGPGIPPGVREKMFNPFFTTKPPGEGTGLGLSMSYDIIVKQHGGRIDVDTELGKFTEFIVTLPRKGLVRE
jgi:two-component system NtrC family sensor kinase